MDLDDLVRDSLPVNAPYLGMAAEAYDVWLPPDGRYTDRETWAEVVVEGDGPALELGCGNGRLLVDYVGRGLDVSGVDESTDMLELCRRHLDAAGLSAPLHAADWRALDLGRTYATLYNPAGSFALLHEPEDAHRALASWRRLVRPGGRLVLAVTGTAPPDDHWAWRIRRSATRPSDGATFIVFEATSLDRDGETTHSIQRCERWDRNGELVATSLRRHRLRWWPPERLVEALRGAGFERVEVDGPPAYYLVVAHPE